MTTVPLTDWSPQNREDHCHRVVRGGWLRMPPPMMGLLLMGLTCEDGPMTREEVRPFVYTSVSPIGDWQASCWEDEAERDGDELADLQVEQAISARYAAHYGLPRLRTLNDMLTLMIAAGLVHEIPDTDGVLRLHPAYPLPEPCDVFPLDEDELAVQQSLRREAAYGSDSCRIIGLFKPAGERREEIATSLDRLARVIDGHPHDARQAVGLLLDARDFTTTADISVIPSHRVFRLRCDWAKFDAHRMRVRRGREGWLAVTVYSDWDGSG
ncbi:DUF6042 family protein [Streptomyces mirabilis]|uniref:DUF6042 family protein n=1 Tax=Streptomyces mirabilis TaxID=68239 RepID=UPI0036B12883